jgi:hypothetical protein
MPLQPVGARQRDRERHWADLPHQLLSPGVPDGHFQHQLRGDLEELRVIAVGLEQEWQDIKAAPWGFPALLDADLQRDPCSHRCWSLKHPSKHGGPVWLGAEQGSLCQPWRSPLRFLQCFLPFKSLPGLATEPAQLSWSRGVQGSLFLQQGSLCPPGTPRGLIVVSAVCLHEGPQYTKTIY